MCTFSVVNWPLITFLFWRVHAHGCIPHWLENRAIHSGAFSRQGALKENNIKVEDTIPFLTRHEIKLGRFKHRLSASVSVSLSLLQTPHCGIYTFIHSGSRVCGIHTWIPGPEMTPQLFPPHGFIPQRLGSPGIERRSTKLPKPQPGLSILCGLDLI